MVKGVVKLWIEKLLTIISGRFVAAKKMTFFKGDIPSNSFSIWLNTRSQWTKASEHGKIESKRESVCLYNSRQRNVPWTPEVPSSCPLSTARASNSSWTNHSNIKFNYSLSWDLNNNNKWEKRQLEKVQYFKDHTKKMTEGAALRAFRNTSRIPLSDSPTYLFNNLKWHIRQRNQSLITSLEWMTTINKKINILLVPWLEWNWVSIQKPLLWLEEFSNIPEDRTIEFLKQETRDITWERFWNQNEQMNWKQLKPCGGLIPKRENLSAYWNTQMNVNKMTHTK